jgi:predicted small secreted protein
MKPPVSLLLILAVAMAASLILTGCSTVGSAIDGTGRALSKAGRSVKNI